MSAARLLGSSRGCRYGALAAITCSGVTGICRRNSRICFDSPATANWPQDASLITQGRRSLRQEVERDPLSQKKGDAEIIDETGHHHTYSPSFEDDDFNAWETFSKNFNKIKESVTGIEWTGVGDKITDLILPVWARQIPDAITKLQIELSMKPGSLSDDIWHEAQDPDINPEILWDARVNVSDDLCEEEKAFRAKRKKHIVKAFAKYLEINERDIHPEDVPTIAFCGSGGGLRALVAGASSYLSAQKAGLFDCATYTAGVSGSCWLQSLYFSSLGQQNHQKVIDHLKTRLSCHVAFPPAALKLITSAPTNKFLLSGLVEKLRGDPGSSFGLVDLWGILLTARLLVPKGDLDVQDRDLKLSNQRIYTDSGNHPMPIYSAVRHEIPIAEVAQEAAKDSQTVQEKVVEKVKKEALFQWLELTPYSVYCADIGASIPTWSLGRPFKNGHNELLDSGVALPEIRQSLLLGIWGSAFCATLSHYYKEVRPLLSGLIGFEGLDQLVEEKNDDLLNIHPIEPATIPNFVYGMKGKLPPTCPESVPKQDHIQLMDAGMSNNLPIYPLLRPGRDVDIIVAFDVSANIQKENWLSVVDGYARQRGIINGWPIGAGWPKGSSKTEENVQALMEAQESSSQEAATKIAMAREEKRRPQSKEGGDGLQSPKTSDKSPNADSDLGYCNIWVGTKVERASDQEPPPSKRLSWEDPEDSMFRLMVPNAGITVIYLPFIPNAKVDGVDPDKCDYLSTWNFVYKPEQIDNVVALARANFEEGQEQIKRTVRTVYERRKKARLEKEEKGKIKHWIKKLKEHGDHFL